MDRILTKGLMGHTGRFRPEQIATQATWDGVGDTQKTAAAMHVIHIVPRGSTTTTFVNPLDPGSDPQSYKYVPTAQAPVYKAWRP